MKIKDAVFCFAHLRWFHNGWAANTLILFTPASTTQTMELAMSIHHYSIEDGQNKKKIASFILLFIYLFCFALLFVSNYSRNRPKAAKHQYETNLPNGTAPSNNGVVPVDLSGDGYVRYNVDGNQSSYQGLYASPTVASSTAYEDIPESSTPNGTPTTERDTIPVSYSSDGYVRYRADGNQSVLSYQGLYASTNRANSTRGSTNTAYEDIPERSAPNGTTTMDRDTTPVLYSDDGYVRQNADGNHSVQDYQGLHTATSLASSTRVLTNNSYEDIQE